MSWAALGLPVLLQHRCGGVLWGARQAGRSVALCIFTCLHTALFKASPFPFPFVTGRVKQLLMTWDRFQLCFTSVSAQTHQGCCLV